MCRKSKTKDKHKSRHRSRHRSKKKHRILAIEPKTCGTCKHTVCQCLKAETFKASTKADHLVIRSVKFINCDNKIKVKTRIRNRTSDRS